MSQIRFSARVPLRQLLDDLEQDRHGWNGQAGRAAIDLIRLECTAESRLWTWTAGSLAEVGVAPVWQALDEWRRSDRSVEPMAVLRRTARRAYSAEAAAVQLGVGDPVNRRRALCNAISELGSAAGRRADIDMTTILADELAEEQDHPTWMVALAVMLRQAGWAWPQPAGQCLAATVMETRHSRRQTAWAPGQMQTGVPKQTWSALALLVAGSGPGCALEHRWPGAPAIYDAGGVAAIRESAEIRRVVDLAVAGRPARSGRRTLRRQDAAA